jgi:DNA-nicking Smr family endonuclease
MDFSEILNKWEKRKSPVTINEILRDKDSGYIRKPTRETKRLRSKKPDDVLDIHGKGREEAVLALDRFFLNAKNMSFQKLLIIHGKGNHSEGDAILKKAVREYIERCPIAGESGFEKSSNGGTGATWVLLKNRNSIEDTQIENNTAEIVD